MYKKKNWRNQHLMFLLYSDLNNSIDGLKMYFWMLEFNLNRSGWQFIAPTPSTDWNLMIDLHLLPGETYVIYMRWSVAEAHLAWHISSIRICTEKYYGWCYIAVCMPLAAALSLVTELLDRIMLQDISTVFSNELCISMKMRAQKTQEAFVHRCVEDKWEQQCHL